MRTVWDEVFATKEWGRWPAEPVVRATVGVARRLGRPLHVLEIGCGPGAQLWYLEHEGHLSVGVDLSHVGTTRARTRLDQEGVSARLAVGDARLLPLRGATFDLVLDVEAFAHNHEHDYEALWREAARVTRPGGHLLSLGFTKRTFGAGAGTALGTRTVSDIPEGPLAGVGTVAFLSEEVATAAAEAAGLRVEDVQTRAWTVGPRHLLVEELIVLAEKPVFRERRRSAF